MIRRWAGTTHRVQVSNQATFCSVFLSFAFVLGSAHAAPSEVPNSESPARAVPELCVQIISGPSPLEPEPLRAAIEKELGVKTTSAATATSIGTVRVESGRGSLVTIRYASADGSTQLQRRIALPVDPARRATVIAWIVGNLVRNEADEILLGMLSQGATDGSNGELAANPTARSSSSSEAAATEQTSTSEPARVPTPTAQPRPALQKAPTKAGPPATKTAAVSSHAVDLGPTRAFHAALFSPSLAVPTDAQQHAFHLSLGGVYSHVGGLDGFGVGLLVDRIEYRSRGAQVSALWTDTNQHTGMLIAGLGTRGRGNLQGAELATVLTLRSGCVAGAQITGVWAGALGSCASASGGGVSHGSALQGVQLAGVGTHVGGDLEGAQVAGVAAVAAGRNEGLQLSGAFAYSGLSGHGAQVAGAANVTNGALQGLQLSGAFNYQRAPSKGAQIAGAVNVANDVEGLQLGVVNVARDVDGLQLGIVNVARHNRGIALGLFNWSDGARVQPTVFFQNPGYLNAGYRSISGYSTGTISFGYDPWSERARTHFATGPRFAYERFAFGVELGYGWVLEHMKSKPSDRAHELDLIGIASAELVRRVVTVYGGGGVVLPVAGVVAIEPHGLVQGGVAFF
jgi:hypothetical protein